jgi:hypothetical protein
MCAIPRWCFFARTHPPDMSAAATDLFDANVLASFAQIAHISSADITASSLGLLALPIRKGGLGVTSLGAIAGEAYEASRNPTGPSQETRSEVIWGELATTVDKTHCKLRKANRKKGASTWLAPPTTEDLPWPRMLFALALQTRIGAEHADINLAQRKGQILRCDCGFESTPQGWSHHVAGCAKREGYNASRRANAMNAAVQAFVLEQPRGLEVGVELEPAVAQSIYADTLLHTEAGPLILDWGVFTPTAKSGPSAAKTEAVKRRQYAHVQATVITCAMSSMGGMTVDTARALKTVEIACDAPPGSLRKHLSRVVVEHTASMSRSARLRVCAGEPASVRTGPPHITAGIGLDLLAPASDDDADEPYEIGLPASKKQKAVVVDEEVIVEEEEEEESEEEEEVKEEENGATEEKAIEIEDDEVPPFVSLPADSPLLFVSVTPKNSLLVTDEEADVDREVEIVGETPFNETVEARKWKDLKGKNNVTFSEEKKEKQEGTGQRGADPAPTPKRWVE